MRAGVPGLRASIGVSSGPAVGGTVGTRGRYEYSVIGDPVNEAARRTTAAKGNEHLGLVNHVLVERADPDEAAQWAELEPIVVRGRSEPTRVATLR